jgi:predicted dehydrogenase
MLNLVDASLGLKPNGSDGRLGYAAMQIIEAACQSSRTNVPVKVHT